MKTLQLNTYASLAAAFLATHKQADAQLIFTEVDPDKIITSFANYGLDFNDDGIDEIVFEPDYYYTWTSFGGASWGYSSQNMDLLNYANVAFSESRPMFLPLGDVVDDTKPFTSGSLNLFYGKFNISPETLEMYSGESWINTEGFIGVKFNIDANVHYGWVRVTLNHVEDGRLPSLTIKDYAYNATPGEGAETLLFSASTGKNLILSDIGETNTANDLQLQFDKAVDESTVSAYRIILDKSYPYPTLAEANLLPPDRYTEILPTGSDITVHFNETTLDVDGNPLIPATNYRAYVLSVADGVLVSVNDISIASNAAQYTFVEASPAAYPNLAVNFIDDDMSAFYVTYNFYTTDVDTMKVLITDYIYYELDELLTFSPDYFVISNPVIGPNTVTFTPDNLVYLSETPVLFNKYYCYLVSVPDGTESSFYSYTFTTDYFLYPYTDIAPEIINSNISGNITDIHVNYPMWENEEKINEYLIVVVPEGQLFTNTMVDTLGFTEAYDFPPNGEDISKDMLLSARDVNGDVIVPGIYYHLYVVLKGNVSPVYYTCSQPSAAFILTAPLSASAIENTIAMECIGTTLHVMLSNLHTANMQIVNAAGVIVYQNKLINTESAIDLSFLPAGMYIATVTTDNEKTNFVFPLTK